MEGSFHIQNIEGESYFVTRTQLMYQILRDSSVLEHH